MVMSPAQSQSRITPFVIAKQYLPRRPCKSTQRRRLSSLRSPNDLARSQTSATTATEVGGAQTGTGDGSNGGGKQVPTSRFTLEDDHNEGSDQSPTVVLAKAGLQPTDLPPDLQQALAAGLLSGLILQRWLQLSSVPVLGILLAALPAFRDRVLGNSRFLLVLAVEVVMGGTAKLIAEKQSRGENFWKELDFVASDMALELIGDVSIVWFLSPMLSLKPPPQSGLGRWTSCLPGFSTQIGNYRLQQRVGCIFYRGLQFFLVGFGSSVVGHSFTKYLVRQQEQRSGTKAEKELAPVLDNSVAWGAFVGISSNLRYQVIGTIEERILDVLVHNAALRTGLTLLLRFSNTFVGGQQWVWYARVIGLQ